MFALCGLVLVGVPAYVIGAPISLDVDDLEGGQPIRAAPMRDRFETLQTESNAQDERIAALEELLEAQPLAVSEPVTLDVPTTGGSFVEIVSVELSPTGGPVMLQMVPGSDERSDINCTTSTSICGTIVRFERAPADDPDDWTTVAELVVDYAPVSSLSALDEPAAGSYVYRLSGRTSSGSYVGNFINVALMARQITP